MTEMKRINTEQLKTWIDNPDISVIDIRSPEAYNGWRLRDEKRGGHIEGARNLPYKWLDYIDWLEIVEQKNIRLEQRIIVYGYEASESEAVARQFIKAGYLQAEVYTDFIEEWSADSDLPMQSLKRYRHLVSAEWLDGLMKNGTAPEYDNDKFVICHSHYQNPADYEKGHIPGAIPLDTNWLEAEETWNRRSPEELRKVLEASGITCDTTVILYGRFSFPNFDDPFPGSSAGHLGAMRCAFILLYTGVEDVRILNGGLQSWTDAGYSVTAEPTAPIPVADFGATIPAHPEYAVDTPQAKRIIASPDANLVSVRSWREFIGEVSGYHYIEKKGRIPGAVFGNCGSDAYHMENYRNPDHTTREYHEIESNWREAGITADKHNAFYCGTGWRGSEAFFNAWLMGWPQASVYDGGWFEWSSDPANRIETGEPDKR